MKRESQSQIELQKTAEGILIPIHAQPRSRKNAVIGVHAGRLKVAVTPAPEKGQANEAILKTLAAALSVRPSQVHLSSGGTARQKTVTVTGLEINELRRRLKLD